MSHAPLDPVIRNVAYAVVVIWGVCRLAVVLGWADPVTPELAVQSLSSTDALMSFVAGYLYAGSVQRKGNPSGQQFTEQGAAVQVATVTTTQTLPPAKDAAPKAGEGEHF